MRGSWTQALFAVAAVCCAVLGLLILSLPPATAAGPARNVLILYADNPRIPGIMIFNNAFQSALAARASQPVEIFHEFLDLERFPFLCKPVNDDDLLRAVHEAIEQDRLGRQARQEEADIRRRLATLTPREREVLERVIAGRLNKQIAAELGTVEKTIKVHRAHVMEKMQVRSVAELVQLAARAGITAPPTA